MRKRSTVVIGLVGALVVLLAACGSSGEVVRSGPSVTSTTVPGGGGSSDPNVLLARVGEPGPLPAGDVLSAAGKGEQAFALALYGELASQKGNLAIAPSSIATVLGMVAAGAKGATRQQIVDALRVPLPATQLDAAIGGLVRALAERSGDGVTLSEVDQAWVQNALHLLDPFAGTLTRDYAAPLARIDFGDPTAAATTINRWVSDGTHGKIPTLISPEALSDAKLVLTDAVYLDAKWEIGFDPKLTTDRPFTLADGSSVSVPTMRSAEQMLATGRGRDWTAVALPYKGKQLEMDVIVPDDLAQFERSFNGAELDRIVRSLKSSEMTVYLPKFEFRTHYDNLVDPLGKLGIRAAFDPNTADLSGMTSDAQLFLSAIVHEAFVHVDEQGTVAAGATAGIAKATSLCSNCEIRVDKPFLFAVRDRATGAIVFLGRVTDPRRG